MPKTPFNVKLDADLLDRARNAVWWIGQGLTLGGLLEDKLKEIVVELEARNGGKPWPERTGELPHAKKRT